MSAFLDSSVCCDTDTSDRIIRSCIVRGKFGDKAPNFPGTPATFRKKRKSTQPSMNHVFRKYASQKVWLSFSYLQFNADTVVWFSTSAVPVTGDNAIVQIFVGQQPKERRIDRPSSVTGRPKKAVKPIAWRNSEGGLKKTVSVKKTWMMRVQHRMSPMLACS